MSPCDACPLNKETPVKAVRSNTCGILIIGSAPITSKHHLGVNQVNLIESAVAKQTLQRDENTSQVKEVLGYTSLVRCKTPGNREPTEQEISCCSVYLKKTIEVLRPKVVVTLGAFVFKHTTLISKSSENDISLPIYRGHSYYRHNESHSYIMIHTLHPSEIKTDKDSSDSFYFESDLGIAVETYLGLPVPHVNWQAFLFPFYYDKHVKIDYDKGYSEEAAITLIVGINGLAKMREVYNRIITSPVCGFDIETGGFKPYDGTPLVSFAISTGTDTLAVYVNIEDDEQYRTSVLALLKEFLVQRQSLILIHNSIFEYEWMLYMFGQTIVDELKGHMIDTMVLAYLLPQFPKKYLLSLEDICYQIFGFDLKGMYDLDRSKMAMYEPGVTLRYNVGDAIVLPFVYSAIMNTLAQYKQIDAVNACMGGSIATSVIMNNGMPVNKKAALKLKAPLQAEIKRLEEELNNSKEYIQFKRMKGRMFSPSSSPDMQFLLYDILGIEVAYNKKSGSITADKSVLQKHAEQYPVLATLEEVKELTRFHDTVVNPIITGYSSNGAYIQKDRRVHASYAVTRTRTGRSACKNPNLQNVPVRKFRNAKDIFGFEDPSEFVCVAADLGQIDWKGIVMSCQDPTLIRAAVNEEDIHLQMGKELIRVSPTRYKLEADALGIQLEEGAIHPKILKNMRNIAKSGLVFARAYRAGVSTVASTLRVSMEEAEEMIAILDKLMPGVPAWHEDLYAFYNKYRCVRSVSGTILFNDLAFGDIANYGIQYHTRYIFSLVLARLAKIKEIKLVNEIHDAAEMVVRRDELNDLLPIIGECFCKHPEEASWSFMIPLVCDVSVSDITDTGVGFGTKTKVKDYSSRDFGWTVPDPSGFRQFYDRQFEPILRHPVYFTG